ncbi:class I SAM-dependent methyltransferase [Ottowia testudinis]|uniref:Class I SAM-dependent methyltransferase n=1 Tax=Ottowia testudinis TaxID=2816950 RepID=A0A975CP35_9BURK|nr:class I SAM-dependent methyltransferase [Ottowia testudinis]QTD47083.1 class I SAM-dependent methyltransferase [Ottowia testudinis]
MTRSPAQADIQPSPWVWRFSPLLKPGAAVLDVACGRGRHMRWLAQLGHAVTGVDRDAGALAAAQAWGRTVQADIENGPWPFADHRFGAVVVTNYLWRPLLPAILNAVAPGGLLIYETFAQGNETVGKPSRPDFLLRPGELLTLCAGPDWRVVAYEDGFLAQPERFVQRIAAVRQTEAPSSEPPRYLL